MDFKKEMQKGKPGDVRVQYIGNTKEVAKREPSGIV